MNNQEMADDMAFRMAQSIAAAIAPLLQQATTTTTTTTSFPACLFMSLVPKIQIPVHCAYNSAHTKLGVRIPLGNMPRTFFDFHDLTYFVYAKFRPDRSPNMAARGY
jgi:hypothetical protein